MHASARKGLGFATAVLLGGAAAVLLSPGTARAQYCETNYCGNTGTGRPYCDWIYYAFNCDYYVDSSGNLRCTTRGCPLE